MNKITVLGSLNMDLVINTPRIPAMGETIHGQGFATFPGGKGANQAVAAARLGGDVKMIGCVGGDSFGQDLIGNLIQNNVGVENIKTVAGISTGIAVIVIKEGNNFIILDSGANFKLQPEDVDRVSDVIKTRDILMLQLEIPMEVVEKAVRTAKEYGVKVLLNPAPAKSLPDELLSEIDIFTPNESEAEFITGINIKSVPDAQNAVKYLMDKKIGQVVITLGSQGVVYNRGNEIIHKPVPQVKVVDTTAAGDSFSGALAVALSNNMTIDEAVDFANIVGTITVTRKGAQSSLPLLSEVADFIKSNNED